MRATARRVGLGPSAFQRSIGLLLAGLFLVAAVQGCTSQSGSKGPSHPTGQTGGTDAGLSLTAATHPGPGADQFIITVILQSVNGRPVEGSQVTLLTTAGSLNPPSGITDSNGRFSSVLTCDGPAFVGVLTEGLFLELATCGAVAPTTAPTPAPGTQPRS